MINLQKQSGLPIELTDDFHLKFNAPLTEVVPAVRTFADMKVVLMDPQAKSDRAEMYYMYRDVHLPQDEELIRKNNVRYDITILPPAMLEQEFNKTVGHYHPKNSSGVEFPELYEVLYGDALFLIQKDNDVRAIEAHEGDKIIYPPGYGHVIVNIGSKPLVTANWVAGNFQSLYGPISEKHGMAYYVVSDPKGFKFVKNQNYQDISDVKVSLAREPEFGLEKLVPMYLTGIKQISNLEFLNYPEKYQALLSSLII